MSEVKFYNIATDEMEPITQEVVDSLFRSCMVHAELMSGIQAICHLRREFAEQNTTKEDLSEAIAGLHRAVARAVDVREEKQRKYREAAQ